MTSSVLQAKENAAVQITDDEAAVYDRQIRLWGVDAQKRLRTSNVLLIGIGGVGSEIAKNLVLSGVESFTILDSTNVDLSDTTASLFTMREIGKNRAKISQPLVQRLNPMVRVSVLERSAEDLFNDSEALKLYQVVILTDTLDKKLISRANDKCRELGIKFYYSADVGLFSASFVDLGPTYSFLDEVPKTAQVGEITLDSGVTAAKTEKNSGDQEVEFQERSLDFVPFAKALQVKAGKAGVGLTKRTSPVLIMFHALLEFYDKTGRFPSTDFRKEDEALLLSLQSKVVDDLMVDKNIIARSGCEAWVESVFGHLSPITSIVGGMIGQDVIRSLTGKHAPIRNFFLFNGLTLQGSVESIGKDI